MIATLLGYKTTENKTAIISYDTHYFNMYTWLDGKTETLDPDHFPLYCVARFIDENPISEITNIDELTQIFDDEIDFDCCEVADFNPSKTFMQSMEKINDAFVTKGLTTSGKWNCCAHFVMACVDVFIPLGCANEIE